MDRLALASFALGSALQVLCWLVPADKLPRTWRNTLMFVSALAILYGLAVFSLEGARAMRLPLTRGWFIVAWSIVGAAVAMLVANIAWQQSTPTGEHQSDVPPIRVEIPNFSYDPEKPMERMIPDPYGGDGQMGTLVFDLYILNLSRDRRVSLALRALHANVALPNQGFTVHERVSQPWS